MPPAASTRTSSTRCARDPFALRLTIQFDLMEGGAALMSHLPQYDRDHPPETGPHAMRPHALRPMHGDADFLSDNRHPFPREDRALSEVFPLFALPKYPTGRSGGV